MRMKCSSMYGYNRKEWVDDVVFFLSFFQIWSFKFCKCTCLRGTDYSRTNWFTFCLHSEKEMQDDSNVVRYSLQDDPTDLKQSKQDDQTDVRHNYLSQKLMPL